MIENFENKISEFKFVTSKAELLTELIISIELEMLQT